MKRLMKSWNGSKLGLYMVKHFTTSTYILNESLTKTLFMLHPKFHKWLPPGGHIEENETPEEAARREIAEETGVNKVKFILPDNKPSFIDNRTEMLLRPHFMMSQLIETDHYHLDMIFFAITDEQSYKSPEDHTLRWFTFKEVKEEQNIFDNVKNLALYAFENLEIIN